MQEKRTRPTSPATKTNGLVRTAGMTTLAIILAMVAVLAGNSENAKADVPSNDAPGPTWLTAETVSKTQIDLSWPLPSDDGGAAVTEFKLEVSTDNKVSWSELTTTTDFVYSDTGLTAGTTRWYRVFAINSVGTGSASNVATATTYPSPPPPENFRAESQVNAVALKWTKPEPIEGGFVAGFEYRQSTDGVNWGPWVGTGSAHSIGFTVKGLENGTEYHFELRALHALLANHVGIDSDAVSLKATPNPQFRLSTQRGGIQRGAGDGDSGGPMRVRITLLNGTFETNQDFQLLRGQGVALVPEFSTQTTTGQILPGNTIQVLAGENHGYTVISALAGGGTQYYDIPEYHTLVGRWESGTATPYTIDATTKVLVFDDEEKPEIGITASRTRIWEGSSTTVTVKATPHGFGSNATLIKVLVGDPQNNFANNHDREFTLAQGDTTRSFTITSIQDTNNEGDYETHFYASRPRRDHERDSYTISSTKGVATVVVVDDDATSWKLSIGDAEAHEEDGHIEFDVWLTDTTTRSLSVGYATRNGTARAGQDYRARSGTLLFSRGDRKKTIQVPIIDDSVNDDGETFTVKLSNPNPPDVLGFINTIGTGTIRNHEGEADDPEPATEPFTADFSSMPGSHDGENEFSFTLTLSEEPKSGFSYETLRDDAFEVENGSVTKARRQETGNNRKWTIYVAPDGDGDITITLPPTTDCSADGAICTGDDRKLSNRESETVEGPDDEEESSVAVPGVSIADAEADEGDSISFTVSLSESTTTEVSVGYATSSGSATQGADFSNTSGTLSFAAGATSKTITVNTTEDSTDEADETFTVTLSNPSNATLSDATATGTIKDDDEPPALTASIQNEPQSHDGSTAFTFEIHFSEDLHDDFSYKTLRDDALSASGGTVDGARRLNPDSEARDKSWRITATPSGNGNVTITLPATTDCNADGAICTEDERMLSKRVQLTVNGPS